MSARGTGQDIILQAFHWNLVKTKGTGTLDGRPESWYSILTAMAEQMAALGFTVVYLPPPWRDDSCWESAGKHGGGEGYFWRDFDLDSRYGTKAELTTLISKCHALGLKVIADLVTNHRDHERMQRNIWPHPGPHWARGGVDCGGAFMDGSADLALDHPELLSRILVWWHTNSDIIQHEPATTRGRGLGARQCPQGVTVGARIARPHAKGGCAPMEVCRQLKTMVPLFRWRHTRLDPG
jgi:hypothetical protein